MPRFGTSLDLTAAQQQRLALGQVRMLHLLALPCDELERHLERALVENPVLDAEAAPGPGGRGFASLDADEVDRLAASEPSWREDLLQQARLLPVESALRSAVERLILELDDDGLLRSSLEELARRWPEHAGCLSQALALVQAMEPAGVGARSRREALKIQWLRRYGSEDPLARLALALLDWEPDGSAPLDVEALARRLGAPTEQVEHVLHRLRRLNPSPVSSGPPAPALRPDLSVRLEDGRIRVEVREPRIALAIDPEYRALARSSRLEEEDRAYLQRHLQEARWLLGGVRRRQATLRALAVELFTLQRRFLERGPEELRPLHRYELARRLGLHPSTVGRALAGKWAQTPWGLHPMERFFPRALPRRRGRAALDGDVEGTLPATPGQVRAWIRQAIGQEDRAHPRSDQALALDLAAAGLPMARRTVAKYRQEMGIPPARARRRALGGSG